MTYLIIFLMLLVSGGFVIISDMQTPIYPILILSLLYSIIKSGRLSFPVKSTLAFTTIIGTLLIGLAIRFNLNLDAYIINIIAKATISLFLVVYLFTLNTNNYWTHYIKLANIITIISIFVFMLANITPQLLYTYHVDYIYEGALRTWLGLGYFKESDYIKYGFLRNSSFFWEPGVFGVYLITAYILQRYYLLDRKYLSLYKVGIISTFSMGAISILAILIISDIFIKNQIFVNRYLRYISLIAIIILLSFLTWLTLSKPEYISSAIGIIFKRDITIDTSISIRLMDLILGFEASLKTIWFGHGGNFDDYYLLTSEKLGISKEGYSGGITNSFTSMLYQFGIFFTLFYMRYLRQFSQIVCKDKSQHSYVIFVALIMALMLEPLYASVWFLTFIFAGASLKRLHNN